MTPRAIEESIGAIRVSESVAQELVAALIDDLDRIALGLLLGRVVLREHEQSLQRD